jgi:hypothetical protein
MRWYNLGYRIFCQERIDMARPENRWGKTGEVVFDFLDKLVVVGALSAAQRWHDKDLLEKVDDMTELSEKALSWMGEGFSMGIEDNLISFLTGKDIEHEFQKQIRVDGIVELAQFIDEQVRKLDEDHSNEKEKALRDYILDWFYQYKTMCEISLSAMDLVGKRPRT